MLSHSYHFSTKLLTLPNFVFIFVSLCLSEASRVQLFKTRSNKQENHNWLKSRYIFIHMYPWQYLWFTYFSIFIYFGFIVIPSIHLDFLFSLYVLGYIPIPLLLKLKQHLWLKPSLPTKKNIQFWIKLRESILTRKQNDSHGTLKMKHHLQSLIVSFQEYIVCCKLRCFSVNIYFTY